MTHLPTSPLPRRRSRTTARWWSLLLMGALLGTAGADEQTRRVQEELRRRNLFFGEVDGRPTAEMREALKRYQTRKGFTADGDPAPETLASLGIVTPGEAEGADARWPEQPVLKSDSARELTDAERDRLALASGELTPIAEPPSLDAAPAPFEAAQPSAPEPTRRDAPPPIPDSPAVPPRLPARSAPGPEASDRSNGHLAPKPPTPTPRRTTPATAEATRPCPGPSDAPVSEIAAVERFVREYLETCAANEPQHELSYYAPSMRYFDQGTVNLAFVEKDMRRYYKRWPHRHYDLLSLKITPVANSPHDFVARFRIHFTVSSEQAHASGQTDNLFGVRIEGGVLKFTSLQESRVRG